MNKIETSDHILDCAIELFWSKSYHGVNMNALSRAANLNKATVYQHFSSKEELAVSAISRAGASTKAYVYLPAFEEEADPREQITGIYQRVYDMHASIFKSEGTCRGCPFVNLGVELSTSSEVIRLAVEEVFAGFKDCYARIVDQHFGTEADEASKESLARALMSNMNGCLVEAKIENRPGAILEGRERALRILGL